MCTFPRLPTIRSLMLNANKAPFESEANASRKITQQSLITNCNQMLNLFMCHINNIIAFYCRGNLPACYLTFHPAVKYACETVKIPHHAFNHQASPLNRPSQKPRCGSHKFPLSIGREARKVGIDN